MTFSTIPGPWCPRCGRDNVDAASGGMWVCNDCCRWFPEGDELNESQAAELRKMKEERDG